MMTALFQLPYDLQLPLGNELADLVFTVFIVLKEKDATA